MSAEEPEAWTVQPGDVIDSYVVERKLGEGGMGAVYKGHHRDTKYPVAIKILVASAASNPDAIARFRREASGANIIGHDSFVKAIHLGSYRDRPYLVMEFLQGTTLADEAKQSPIPVPRAVWILMQIADALEAAHKHGIIHRDIKPDNIFLVDKGGASVRDLVKILDLGIAKFLNDTAANKTHSHALLGTPHTMSPEQCRGSHIDHRSDIYALGVVAYYIISGRWPIDGQYYGDIQAGHMFDEPPSLHHIAPWVPASLANAIHRALAKDPAARFQSMADFYEALARFAEPSGPARVSGPMAATVQAVRRETSAARLEPLYLVGRWRRHARPTDAHASAPGVGEAAPTGKGESRGATTTARSPRAALVAVGALVILGAGGTAIYYATRPTAAHENEAAAPSPSTPKQETVKPLTPPPETFRVFVDVAPADAELLVDGVAPSGRPPIALEGTPGRTFKVEARRDGYRPLAQQVKIAAHDERIALRLVENAETESRPTASSPASGTLYVNVEPWAYVSVDGGKNNDTPFHVRLAAGSHRLVIENPAMKKHKEMKIVVQPGKTKKIDLDLNQSE